MSMVYHGTTLDEVVYHGIKLDYLYRGNVLVYESTKYVAKPVLTSGSFTFDNAAKSPTITGYDADAMERTGTLSATAAGNYSVTFTLKERYAWADGTTAPVVLSWSIAKRTLAIPSLTNNSYTWATGKTFKPTVNNFNGTYENQSGTVSSTSAGSWTVTWSLKYPASTQWSDGTTGNKTGSWSVAKLKLNIPSLTGTTSFAFVGGTTRTVSVSGFNGTYETQSGTTSTDALGTHTVTWALRDTSNTTWSDGTTGSKSASWYITWVNGTSHYANDLYNKGWYNNGLAFRYGQPTWNADNFELNQDWVRTASTYTGKTFHATIRVTDGTRDVSVLDLQENWRSVTAQTFSVGTAFMDIATTHSQYADGRYFGIRNAASNYSTVFQRIWIT